MLDDATIEANIASIRTIFEPFPTFGDGPTDAVMVNNHDWLGQLGYIELLQEVGRSEEHTSELQSLMRISYAVFCLKKNKNKTCINPTRSTLTYATATPVRVTVVLNAACDIRRKRQLTS